MNTTRAYNLPIHNHPLFPSAKFICAKCGGCRVTEIIYGGYYCNEPDCYVWFHKECAEAPPEIHHHPSHLEHPLLLLTNDSPTRDGTPCDCCGDELLSPCYTCPTCGFKVDLICGMKPPRPAIEHPMCHEHSLVFLKKREVGVTCDACKESIGGASYSCLECHNVYFHLGCVHLSKEVNHPCHSNHSLKVVALESLADNPDAEKSCCHFCEFQPEKKMYYHCSLCNFTMCFGCTKHPPPLVFEDTKTHKHPLRLFPSNIMFTCKICGIKEFEDIIIPYICFTCDFIVHRKCIGLPRVININRHDHRISFTQHLGRRGTKCGVCRRNVSQYYGAYFCLACPDYTVHSRCAVDYSVWNGVELEGIPEESEDIPPFKVVGYNLIRHFSHSEHTLTLLFKDNVIHKDKAVRCEACIGPVGFGPIYACGECPFVLHEKCANLATKKRLVFTPFPYTLEYKATISYCMLCRMLFGGFKYTMQRVLTNHYLVDVHCGSLSEPFVHNCHLHPLYFYKIEKDRYCNACKNVQDEFILSCGSCNFYLCLYCATLPEKIWHMSDEHPLTLLCDLNRSCKIWCDVCEGELDPMIWFFACSDCEVTLHVQCALGDFSRLMPGNIYIFGERDYEVVLYNRYTRPFCSHCHSRCKAPVILKDTSEDNGYICSNLCLSSFLGVQL